MNIKKLFAQIIKFGIVGFICFLIDFGIYALMANLLDIHYLIAGATGFIISTVINYLLSMRFVFTHRDDLSRRREFIVFFILSLLGCGLNELVLFISIDLIYESSTWLTEHISTDTMKLCAKILATAIVMVYNFTTRKTFLDKKEPASEEK